ncbi:hypothetical protein GGR57DRAFT_501913 [Xylariaceae sp. FL1272]|nr:hypothetical protein GGR57DRAFT_501913 [Xylariaceae sp. FL1272]
MPLQIIGGGAKSNPIDMSPMLKSLGLDIVGLLAFGYPLRTQTSADNQHIRDTIPAVNYFQNPQMQYPFLKRLKINQLLHLFTNAFNGARSIKEQSHTLSKPGLQRRNIPGMIFTR